MEKCKYQLAWIGQCKEESISESDFCDKHRKIFCPNCGKHSIGECEEDAGNFVCGVELCENKCHKHK